MQEDGLKQLRITKTKGDTYKLQYTGLSELHNLADAQPEQAKESADMWQAYAERANVIPWPDEKKKK